MSLPYLEWSKGDKPKLNEEERKILDRHKHVLVIADVVRNLAEFTGIGNFTNIFCGFVSNLKINENRYSFTFEGVHSMPPENVKAMREDLKEKRPAIILIV